MVGIHGPVSTSARFYGVYGGYIPPALSILAPLTRHERPSLPTYPAPADIIFLFRISSLSPLPGESGSGTWRSSALNNNYLFRKRTDRMRLNYMKSSWHSPDCASCMMIETGEKASHPGLRCDSCGRFPRSIGGYWAHIVSQTQCKHNIYKLPKWSGSM